MIQYKAKDSEGGMEREMAGVRLCSRVGLVSSGTPSHSCVPGYFLLMSQIDHYQGSSTPV